MDETKLIFPPESYKDSQDYIDALSITNFIDYPGFIESYPNLTRGGVHSTDYFPKEFYEFIIQNNLHTEQGWIDNIYPISNHENVYHNGIDLRNQNILNVDVISYSYYTLSKIEREYKYIKFDNILLEDLNNSRFKNSLFFIKDDESVQKDIEHFIPYSIDEHILNSDYLGYGSSINFLDNTASQKYNSPDWTNYSEYNVPNNIDPNQIFYVLDNNFYTVSVPITLGRNDFLRGILSPVDSGNGYKGLSLFSGNFDELRQNNYAQQLLEEIGLKYQRVVVDTVEPQIT